MFHEGSLQSGISLAIQEQKLVACFVRDNGDESSTWENDWLQSGWLSSLLAQKSILLRLDAGSTEAGFLSAFCQISNTPTFVIIQNGQLREQLSSGVDKDDFINRVRKVLGANPIPGVTTQSTNALLPPSSATSTPAASLPQTSSSTPILTPTPPAVTTSTPTPPQPRPVSSVLPPSSKAKGKQKATPHDSSSSPNPSSSTSAAQQAARDALRKKKQEDKEELARIQARIEQDKLARKAEAELRKAERERDQSPSASTATTTTSTTTISTKGSRAKEVNLNVRLFDGRTIRSKFPRTATLQDQVRPWIDTEFARSAEEDAQSQTQSQRQKHQHPPYYFKQIQAPLPSRELSTGEEGEELGEIGLAPSATLILIPVKGYTEAYAGGSNNGPVGNVVGGVTGLVGGAFGLAYSAVGYVGSTLGSIVGIGGGPAGGQAQDQNSSSAGRTLNDAPPRSSADTNTESSPTAPASSSQPPGTIRVRTLADQRERDADRPREFYNGNQLSFEPNNDDSSRK